MARDIIRIITVVFVLSLAVPTAAQGGPPPPPTNVLYGFVTSNRTLTFGPPGPIYYVAGDLVVNPGITLTVEPGVTLLFAAGRDTLGGGDFPLLSEITIQGTLAAVGASGLPIEFRASEAGAGKWGQIRVVASGNLQATDVNLSGAALAIKADGNLNVSRLNATSVQAGAILNTTASGRLFDAKFVGVGSGIGLLIRKSGITAVPDTTDPRPCDVSGFTNGIQVEGGPDLVSHIIAHDNTYGCFVPDGYGPTTFSYLTLVRNTSAMNPSNYTRYLYSSILTNNSVFGASVGNGFCNYVNSWSNGTNFVNGNWGPLTASFNPFYTDYGGSDFHLSNGSTFKGYGPWGAEIGAYGPGPGAPTPAQQSTWGRVKASYR